ncbi:cadherin-like domain-containing protein, partial [Desulfogranum japonicum]|uniref:cadherin-like domain-containing protein n=1 Tax=Desulfogranum japonicum TaxID=231447 RepID=UPI000555C234
MQRYIRLYILVILLFLASLSQVSAVETTEDFEGSSLSSDQCVSGGSAIEAFKFMNSNSEGACLSGAEGASGSKGVYSNYSAGTSDYLTMYLTTGAAFKFVSVYIDDVIGYGSPTYWVAGYSGGSQTEGPDTINVRTAGVHTFNWGNVDSVRFNAILKPDTDPGDGPYTDTLDVAGVFDNITYDSPVAGNTNPSLSTNNGLQLNEGATATIPIDSLEYTDAEQDDATLTYTITDLADHGATKNNGSTLGLNGTFTQSDVTNNLITYVHDGSNTTSDSFIFSVADGVGGEVTNQTFNITIVAIDDDTPTISTNNGLKLNEGATKSIPLDSLEANDTDTDNATLTYTLTSALSNGQAENTDNPGVSISSFTQQNLIDGKIQYVHDGTNTTSDSFTFKVADGVPNELTGQTFSITVVAVDDDTPTISTNNGLKLNEGATKSIPLDSLEANDTDTDNLTLTYTLTSGPANGQTENT